MLDINIPKYEELLEKLVCKVVDIFATSVNSVILYGSVAKGLDSSDSDIDVAVITREYTKEMHDLLTDYIVDLELEYNKVLSVLFIDLDKFNEWGDVMPFYKNVKKEGIQLWMAA